MFTRSRKVQHWAQVRSKPKDSHVKLQDNDQSQIRVPEVLSGVSISSVLNLPTDVDNDQRTNNNNKNQTAISSLPNCILHFSPNSSPTITMASNNHNHNHLATPRKSPSYHSLRSHPSNLDYSKNKNTSRSKSKRRVKPLTIQTPPLSSTRSNINIKSRIGTIAPKVRRARSNSSSDVISPVDRSKCLSNRAQYTQQFNNSTNVTTFGDLNWSSNPSSAEPVSRDRNGSGDSGDRSDWNYFDYSGITTGRSEHIHTDHKDNVKINTPVNVVAASKLNDNNVNVRDDVVIKEKKEDVKQDVKHYNYRMSHQHKATAVNDDRNQNQNQNQGQDEDIDNEDNEDIEDASELTKLILREMDIVNDQLKAMDIRNKEANRLIEQYAREIEKLKQDQSKYLATIGKYQSDFVANEVQVNELLRQTTSLEASVKSLEHERELLRSQLKAKRMRRRSRIERRRTRGSRGSGSFSISSMSSPKRTNGSRSRLSISSGFSGLSGVSSVAPYVTSKNPLVVVLGIGKYSGLPYLPGVLKDYQNFVNTFVSKWKYKVFLKLADNTNVYSNDMKEVKGNYKLKWDVDEIDEFLEEVRMHVVVNNHDGLIFAVSCHGDTGKVIYDSEASEYELEDIFKLFAPQWAQLLESYEETPEQTDRLFAIPKIFFLGCCRGSCKARVTKIENNNSSSNSTITNNNNNNNNVNTNSNTAGVVNLTTQTGRKKVGTREKENIEKNDQSHTQTQTQTPPRSTSVTTRFVPNTANGTTVDTKGRNATNTVNTWDTTLELESRGSSSDSSESFGLKCVSKEEASGLVAQMANFCKVYANSEGYAVADGAENGGVFLRNVVKVFEDIKFVRTHNWDEMVLKIREYTKRDATLFGGDLGINFTQIVEREGTLERHVRFDSMYVDFSTLGYLNNGKNYNYKHYKNGSMSKHITTVHESKQDEEKEQKIGGSVGRGGGDGSDNVDTTSTLVVTNLTISSTIGVLVEQTEADEDRDEWLEQMERCDTGVDIFKNCEFKIIEPRGGTYEFIKLSEAAYITVFVINRNTNTNNREIHDRRRFNDNYLYFNNDSLVAMRDIKIECGVTTSPVHYLRCKKILHSQSGRRSIANSNNINNNNIVSSSGINININIPKALTTIQCGKCGIDCCNQSDVYYHCRKCGFSLCENCSHERIYQKFGLPFMLQNATNATKALVSNAASSAFSAFKEKFNRYQSQIPNINSISTITQIQHSLSQMSRSGSSVAVNTNTNTNTGADSRSGVGTVPGAGSDSNGINNRSRLEFQIRRK